MFRWPGSLFTCIHPLLQASVGASTCVSHRHNPNSQAPACLFFFFRTGAVFVFPVRVFQWQHIGLIKPSAPSPLWARGASQLPEIKNQLGSFKNELFFKGDVKATHQEKQLQKLYIFLEEGFQQNYISENLQNTRVLIECFWKQASKKICWGLGTKDHRLLFALSFSSLRWTSSSIFWG